MLHPYALRLASTSPQSEFHLCLRCSIWPPPGPPLYLLRSVNRFSSPKGHPSDISTLLMLPCYEEMPGKCPRQKFHAAVCIQTLLAGLSHGISMGLDYQHPCLCWDTSARSTGSANFLMHTSLHTVRWQPRGYHIECLQQGWRLPQGLYSVPCQRIL